MKYVNIGRQEAPKWYFVATINLNGEEQEIIPAFTDYSLKRKNFEKDKIRASSCRLYFASVMQNHSTQRMFLYTIT